jgi:hypothetical protein
MGTKISWVDTVLFHFIGGFFLLCKKKRKEWALSCTTKILT